MAGASSVTAIADWLHDLDDIARARLGFRRRMPAGISDDMLTRLLHDPEPAVRKVAVRATSDRNSAAVRGRVAEIAARDTSPRLRRVAEAHARTIAF
jgi:hypothetical protein